MGNLVDRVEAIAQARLAELRTLSYEQLELLREREFTVTGGWWRRAVVWIDISPVAPEVLRVAVVRTATVRLWPSYYHRFDGFRLQRDGTQTELTGDDAYDLD